MIPTIRIDFSSKSSWFRNLYDMFKIKQITHTEKTFNKIIKTIDKKLMEWIKNPINDYCNIDVLITTVCYYKHDELDVYKSKILKYLKDNNGIPNKNVFIEYRTYYDPFFTTLSDKVVISILIHLEDNKKNIKTI